VGIMIGRFIKTSLPNLEKGFGSESRRYAMEARDETGRLSPLALSFIFAPD